MVKCNHESQLQTFKDFNTIDRKLKNSSKDEVKEMKEVNNYCNLLSRQVYLKF